MSSPSQKQTDCIAKGRFAPGNKLGVRFKPGQSGNPGGSWSPWRGSDWAGPGYPKQVYELAAAQQSNGCIEFWALTLNQELITIAQTSPGGDWGEWSSPAVPA